MNDQQTATAILALEECIEQYIAECRGRVDGFVERHFSLQETIALQNSIPNSIGSQVPPPFLILMPWSIAKAQGGRQGAR